jgi:hypothetical protein
MTFNKIQAIKDAREFHTLANQSWSAKFFELGSKLMDLGIDAEALKRFTWNDNGHNLKESKDFIEAYAGGFIISGRQIYEEFERIGGRESFEDCMNMIQSPSYYGWNYHEYKVMERATKKAWFITFRPEE